MRQLIILAALVMGAFAHSEKLTWSEAVNLARSNNAELLAAQATLRSFEYKASASQNDYFPKLAANLGYDYGDGAPVNAGTNRTYSATISATQNLFAGFQDLGNIRIAEAQARAAAASLRIVKAKVSFDLKNAFQGVIYAKEYARLAADIVDRRQANLKLVSLRFDGGRENKGSVLLSQAYFKQSQYDALHAHNLERIAQADLARVLGSDMPSRYEVEGAVPLRTAVTPEPDYQAIVAKVPEYDQAFEQAQSADAAITAARSQFYPTLNLNASIGRQGPTFFPQGENRRDVGIVFSLPLFDGGRDYYGTKSAVAGLTAATATLSRTSRELVTKLENAYAGFIESIAKLESDDVFRNAANVRAEIARRKYNTGLLTFEDWGLIENDLITRQKNYLASERDRTVGEATWEQAQGEGVIP